MNLLSDKMTIWEMGKDILWTVSILIAIIVNCIKIYNDAKIAKEKRILEQNEKQNEEEKKYGLLTKKEYNEQQKFYKYKKLPKRVLKIIQNLEKEPDIRYDPGFWENGWNWFNTNGRIALIIKSWFRFYYRIWENRNNSWALTDRKHISKMLNDVDLKSRAGLKSECNSD